MRELKIGTLVIAAAVAGLAWTLASASDYTLYVVALIVVSSIGILSLHLLMGEAGQVSLGQAALVGAGAFAAAEIAKAGAPFPIPLIAAPAAGALIGVVVGLPALRIRGLQVAATTLAFGLVAEHMIFTRPWDSSSGAAIAIERPAALEGGRPFLLLAIAGLALVLVVDRAIRRSRFGRAFNAVRDREDTAAARGIEVGRTKLLAYAISGAYAGLAGALMAYLLTRVSGDSFTVFTSLGMVAAVVVGGLGSWRGALIAGAAFTGLPELLRSVATIAPLAGAVLLMLTPVLHPAGLGWVLDRPVRARANRRNPRPQASSSTATEPAQPPMRALTLVVPVRTLVRAREVAVSFGGLRALDGVSLDVNRGEIVGLIGPNGAGKSTFFNALSGLAPTDSGSIAFRGRDLLALPASARAGLGIARTFQQVGLVGSRSVRDNALIAQHEEARYGLGSAILRTPRMRAIERALDARAAEGIALTGLGEQADTPVGGAPHGTQRLAEVASAVACAPELLLLDEPFAGLGPEESEALSAMLRTLRDERGITIVVIEHDVPLVTRLCDYLYVFDRGRVLSEGIPPVVQRDPAVVAVYIGEPLHDEREAVGV